MDKIEEMLEEKTKEFEDIKAPEDLEEKLREALERKTPVKHFNFLKAAAIAATAIVVIGVGSLNFSKLNSNKTSSSGWTDNSHAPSIQSEAQSNMNVTFSEPVASGATVTNDGASVDVTYNKALDATATSKINPTFSEDVAVPTTANIKVNSGKKIIKNANVTIEAKQAEAAFDKISGWVNSNGGYEFSRNANNNGASRQVEAVFRISPDKLDQMLKFLKSAGRVVSSQTNSSDISDQYQDTGARLDAMKKGRTQMMEIMGKAKTINDILKVQDELNTMNADIEALQGQINQWDRELAESSVSISIYEESYPIKTEENVGWKFNSPSEVFNSMKNGFINTMNNIFNVIIWILVFISSSVPLLLILAIVAFIIWRYIRKRKA